MAPPESYYDIQTNNFSLSLLNEYPEWNNSFAYHGINCYAYLISKYGKTKISNILEYANTN
jgi:hypothetical protein